jgi:hypothetical protein
MIEDGITTYFPERGRFVPLLCLSFHEGMVTRIAAHEYFQSIEDSLPYAR